MTTNQILIGIGLILVRADGRLTAVTQTDTPVPQAGDTIVFLPKEKIVINADMYGPPPAGTTPANVSANSVSLYKAIKRLRLDVVQHVPIHGNPGSNADFERIVGPVAAKTRTGGDGG